MMKKKKKKTVKPSDIKYFELSIVIILFLLLLVLFFQFVVEFFVCLWLWAPLFHQPHWKIL